jgi:hypothetical protein
MPTYKVPAEDFGLEAATPAKRKYRPTVYFPISKEILNTLEVGQDVEVLLKGKVEMLESRESLGGKQKAEMRLEIHEVAAYAEGEFEKLSRDDD